MENALRIYCWQLKHPLDSDDDINDLHLCIDESDLDEVLDDLEDLSQFELVLECQSFPDKSPQHVDSGMETFMKSYKSEVLDFERINFLIAHEENEILLWNNGFEEAFIKLTDKHLKEIIKHLQSARNQPYLHDHVLQATRITDDNDFKGCKIVIWGGHDGLVVYY